MQPWNLNRCAGTKERESQLEVSRLGNVVVLSGVRSDHRAGSPDDSGLEGNLQNLKRENHHRAENQSYVLADLAGTLRCCAWGAELLPAHPDKTSSVSAGREGSLC